VTRHGERGNLSAVSISSNAKLLNVIKKSVRGQFFKMSINAFFKVSKISLLKSFFEKQS